MTKKRVGTKLWVRLAFLLICGQLVSVPASGGGLLDRLRDIFVPSPLPFPSPIPVPIPIPITTDGLLVPIIIDALKKKPPPPPPAKPATPTGTLHKLQPQCSAVDKGRKEVGVLVFESEPKEWKTLKLGDLIDATPMRPSDLCGLDTALYDVRLNAKGSIYQLANTKENDRVEFVIYVKLAL